MNILKSVEEAIGKTPLIELGNIKKSEHLNTTIYAKFEALNPAGSIKDRAALSMINDAECKGLLKPGGTIIEPTSGNTGIGLAMIAAVRGYRTIIVMPDTMSMERRKLMSAYGAEVILTDGKLGMKGSIEKAQAIQKEIPGSFIAGQFDNDANPKAHYDTTGPEIWDDTDGKIDVLVATAGTGGTLSGTAAFLKEKNPKIKIIAVEPAASPLLSEGRAGSHRIEGIGANFIPEVMHTDLFDEILTVSDDDAFVYGRMLAKKEGILAGISSGAALKAGIDISKRPESTGKNIVIILPDSGSRYISTELF